MDQFTLYSQDLSSARRTSVDELVEFADENGTKVCECAVTYFHLTDTTHLRIKVPTKPIERPVTCITSTTPLFFDKMGAVLATCDDDSSIGVYVTNKRVFLRPSKWWDRDIIVSWRDTL